MKGFVLSLPWPTSQDYNEAVQNPQTSFSDPELRQGQVVVNAQGIPQPCSGNFADVYAIEWPATRSKWAVKCFTREVHGLRERYSEISKHLQQTRPRFTVDFQFLEQGIRIAGCWYPVLKMQWIEGLTLNQFLRQYADKQKILEKLLRKWVRLAKRLREAGIAHGDLQHSNLLLVPHEAGSHSLKLIDYDGMWVPALAKMPSGEVGHPCYQHPQRLHERTYGPEADRFPFLLIATALRAVQVIGKPLWEKYDTGDNLLFRETDLQAPTKSRLFYELLKIDDPLLHRLVDQTLQAVKAPLAAVPRLEEVLPELLGTKREQISVSSHDPEQTAKPTPEAKHHWWSTPPHPPIQRAPPETGESSPPNDYLCATTEPDEYNRTRRYLGALAVSVVLATAGLGLLWFARPHGPLNSYAEVSSIKPPHVTKLEKPGLPKKVEPPRTPQTAHYRNGEEERPAPRRRIIEEEEERPALPPTPDNPPTANGEKTAEEPIEHKVEKPPMNPADPKSLADKPVPVLGTPLKEMVTGYETRRFQGFTFLLSSQAVKEGQKEKGKPFEALQTEFDGLVHVLPANALKHLRGILIWIEWDNVDRSNPNVLAKYHASRIWRLDGSDHPLKSNAVEVLSLKKLTEEKAATQEKSRLVLLHELAHAVHRLALDFNNADVVFAFNQAMDRRLYEKVKDIYGREVRAYAATNALEYFAELSCAYLDCCSYFPFTRADLREHDPTGYRLMQKVWGTGKAPSRQESPSKKKMPPKPPTQTPATK